MFFIRLNSLFFKQSFATDLKKQAEGLGSSILGGPLRVLLILGIQKTEVSVESLVQKLTYSGVHLNLPFSNAPFLSLVC